MRTAFPRGWAIVCLAALPFLIAEVHGVPELTVRDIKGRSIAITVIGANEKTVIFRRVDTGKEFSMALTQFDAESQAGIFKAAADLPPVLPRLDAEVVIGKRRDKGDSYYMVKQEISCTVKLNNLTHDTPLPALTGKVIFIGQNQKTPGDFTVLSTQEFPVGLKPGEKSSTDLKSFSTTYDSDNKGVGNVGGYQYSGYLLVFLNGEKEVVFSQTTDGGIRQAIADKPKLLNAIAGYPKGTYLDAKMMRQDGKLRPPDYR